MMVDPVSILTTEALKQLTTLVIETAWQQGGQSIDKQKQQTIERAVREYVQTYEKRHCSLKYDCLRMDHSLTLEEIHTDVQVLNTRASRRFEPPEALRELFLEVHGAFVDRIYQTWYTALRLNPEWLELSEKNNTLESYLYANELMIRCKEAALRVSPQV